MGPLSLSRANPGLVFWSPPESRRTWVSKVRSDCAPALHLPVFRSSPDKKNKQLGKLAKKLGFFLILSAKNEGWKKNIKRKNRSQQQKCHFNQKKRKLTRRSGVLTKNNWDFTWFNQSFCGLQKNFGHVISKFKDGSPASAAKRASLGQLLSIGP